MTSYAPVVLKDPTTVPEMATVLNAVRRGTRLSRLRTLEVACPSDHQLGQVFGAGDRAVVLAQGRVQTSDGTRDGLGAALLAALPNDIAIRMQCRCQTPSLPLTWLRRQLELKRRRGVWPPPSSSTNDTL